MTCRSEYLQRVPLDWQVAWASGPGGARSQAVPARVPGAAPLDWARAHGLDQFHFGSNWSRLAGLEDRWWSYFATVPRALLDRADAAIPVLVLEGVDFAFDLIVDDVVRHRNEGLHVPVEVALDGLATGEDLRIEARLRPAPKFHNADAWGEGWARAQRSLAARVTKPSVSYGDDFHPSVVPLGLWKPAYVDFRPARHISRHRLTQEVLPDGAGAPSARITAEGLVNGPCPAPASVRLDVFDATGRPVAALVRRVRGRRFSLAVEIGDALLWWPHDHGEPYLYEYRLSLLDDRGRTLDVQKGSFGLRTIRLVMHEGAWEWPPVGRWPKGRSNPPIQVEVNGVPVFARGACCVPLHVYFGTATADDSRQLVEEAVAANFNMVRVSGGCVSYKDDFYAACDRLGLMVWQDFPLACNQHPDDADYLRLLEREAGAMIDSLSPHPSLALWCGGNELFESHSGMTDQSLALRLLDSLTFRRDPQRPFLASTPLMGFAHGPYEFCVRTDGRTAEATDVFRRSSAVAYPEFACPATPSEESLRAIIPAEDLFPPRPGTAWQDHKAFFAFDAQPDTWLNLGLIERYFGPIADLESLVRASQMMQAHALRCMFEEARRQAPTCSLALMWSLNEPWPNAAGLSLLAWPRERKAAFAAISDACRPRLASLDIPEFAWPAGGTVAVTPWILSDSLETTAAGAAFISVRTADRKTHAEARWDFDDVPPKANRRGSEIALDLPAAPAGSFFLVIEVEGRADLGSCYELVLRG